MATLAEAYQASSDPAFYGRCKLAWRAKALSVLAETGGLFTPQRQNLAHELVNDGWPMTRLGELVAADLVTVGASSDAQIEARVAVVFDLLSHPLT